MHSAPKGNTLHQTAVRGVESLARPGPHFFSSHFEGMKRRLGSGPWCSEWISGSRVNQSTSGSYGFTCTLSRNSLARARSGSPCSNAHTTDNNSKTG